MRPEFNYTNEEKEIIRYWKAELPQNLDRTFAYMFVATGKRDGEGYCLYNHILASNDGYKMTLVRNITLG